MRREVVYWRTRYASGVRAFDRRLGELLDYLRATGELDRSLLVFTSDHGEELFEHGDWSHGQNLFDHQLHVPLIVRNPRGRGGGDETETFVDLIDLMPSLLSAAGAEPPERVQGRDVSALFEGRAVERPEITFATATQRYPGLYSVRTSGHKLVYDLDTNREELFDMAEGGAELVDVAEREPGVADELRDRLLTHISESVAGGTLEQETAEIPQELRERLEALGYLQ
jgi:arylsulfatase A-like enzyme